ncbi:unnamed protein product [Arctogadus glacialis]
MGNMRERCSRDRQLTCHRTEAEMEAQELRDPASGKQEPETARKRKWTPRRNVTQPPANKRPKAGGWGAVNVRSWQDYNLYDVQKL